MSIERSLRIGLFTHSTNPRGGVVHVLELGQALVDLGHEVVVHAPAEAGRGFFRSTRAKTVLVPARAAPAAGGLAALVRQRIDEYLQYLAPRGREFDVYHAHDGISGGALAQLADAGVIPGFVRTVHHLDDFDDPYLQRTQERSVKGASSCVCVSQVWRGHLADRYGIMPTVIANGVDTARFSPIPGNTDEGLRQWIMESSDGVGPMFLAVGGVEQRKNTLNILRAYLLARQAMPRSVLLIVGGASLLDHTASRADFDALLAGADPLTARSVLVTGTLADDQMPAAYRLADALVFPSLSEGFGLAVLEAMACGTPVVTSRIAPFTEYLSDANAILVDPLDPQAIATAMEQAVEAKTRSRFRKVGMKLARQHPWSATAKAHEKLYGDLVARFGGSTHASDAVPSAMAQ